MNPVRVYQAKKFAIEEVQPAIDGQLPTAYVRHPGAAVIVPVLPDGRLVLVRNFRPALQQTLLEFPAGTRVGDEPPEACAARELAEETGYTAGSLQRLVALYSAPGFCDERLDVFVARELRPGPQRLEADEQLTVAPMTPMELDDALRSAAVVDAKTAAAWLWFAHGLRAGGAS